MAKCLKTVDKSNQRYTKHDSVGRNSNGRERTLEFYSAAKWIAVN